MTRRLVALVAVVAVAGSTAGRIFDDRLLALLVAGAAAAAAALSAALARGRGTWVAPLSLLALAGYLAGAVALAARLGGVPGGPLALLADAWANGLPRLLGAMIPVTPRPDTVVIPVAAAWLATLVGAELLLRTRRVLLGYAPPTALFVGALYLVGPNAAPAWWQTVAFAALAAWGLAAPASGPDAPPVGGARRRWRRTTAGLAAVAAVGVAAAGGAAALRPVAAARPADPRAHLRPPRLDTLDENPLVRLSGWALAPRQKLFDVRLSAAPTDSRLRLAVLTEYDGVTWRVGATYRSAGRTLPGPSGTSAGGVPAAGRPVRQEVTVAELTGRLLPAAADVHRVGGVRVAYDPAGGTLLGQEPLHPGARYAVDSRRRADPADLLAEAEVPGGAAVAPLLDAGPEPPAPLSRLADRLAGEAVGPYERAAAVEEYLRAHYRLVADAPSGHAYPNLRFFLFGPPHAGGQRGTSEQFAAAYAVLARLLGLPARVVVGFRVPAGGGSVYAGDAVAWPEVLFDGVGWVAFDPLPRPRQRPLPVEGEARPPPVRTPPPTVADAPTPAPAAPAGPSRVAPAPASGGLPAGLVGALSAVLAGAAALASLGLARRRLSRGRLTAPDPGARIAGAWREVRDARRLAGRPLPPHHSAGAVAAAARRAGEPPLEALAEAVNAAAFADIPASAAQAEAAVVAAAAYVAHLRAGRGRWGRWCWPVRPGPLRWGYRELSQRGGRPVSGARDPAPAR
ncbi:hypothetical protein GCM10010124_39360 [Pilimelia terevasa]|uniref:Transglutaminase-like domain-containing protein n=1 Tax=Pilimelia terevasa TaxID=53372 RepID=A0A8J3BQV1_9ACTN|nr:transglutaminase domain-containing protein [Pilimelia terevasa]GGK42658.1 hypothetical protein GCM10010124_39360 [Pilimelia terevasa]